MSKIIYIASPYSHSDQNVQNERYNTICKLVSKLVAEGNVAFSPIVYGHTLLQYHDMPGDWQFWKNFCESFLYKCDEMIVYKMDGWEKSSGVQGEIKLATELGIKITYINE